MQELVCRIKWELKVEFTQGLSSEYLIIFHILQKGL